MTPTTLRHTIDRLMAITHGHLPLDIQRTLVDAADRIEQLERLTDLQGQAIQLMVGQIRLLSSNTEKDTTP